MAHCTRSSIHLRLQKCDKFVLTDAFLLTGVAVTEGDGAVFFDGVKVDGNTKRCANFVLPAVTAPDRAGGVVKYVPAALQFFVERLSPLDQFRFVFQQRENGCFVRRDLRAECRRGRRGACSTPSGCVI